MPRASASSDDAPVTGTRRAWPSPSAVAMPMRSPVKPPGPTPTTTASISRTEVPAADSRPCAASSTRRPEPGSAPSQSSAIGPSSRTRARLGLAVAVSSAKVGNQADQLGAGVRLAGVEEYQPPVPAQVAQFQLQAGLGEHVEEDVRPLDEADRVVERGRDELGVLGVRGAEPVRVDVGDGDVAL